MGAGLRSGLNWFFGLLLVESLFTFVFNDSGITNQFHKYFGPEFLTTIVVVGIDLLVGLVVFIHTWREINDEVD